MILYTNTITAVNGIINNSLHDKPKDQGHEYQDSHSRQGNNEFIFEAFGPTNPSKRVLEFTLVALVKC